MRRLAVLPAILIAMACLAPAQSTNAQPNNAQISEKKVVQDIWDVAYLEGAKAGYVHTYVTESLHGGKKFYQTVMVLFLTVKRNDQVIQLRMETGMLENPQGKVFGTYMRHYLGPEKKLEIVGKVVGKELQLTLDGDKALKPAPWDDRVVGMYRQQRLFAERKVKTGDTFDYLSFEPTVNLVIGNEVEVKRVEEVEMFGGKSRRKLLRVETKPGKIEGQQFPTMISWLDRDFQAVRSQMEAPGLGKILLYRTTKEAALGPAAVAQLPDIAVKQLVRVKRKIARPYASRSAIYRVTVKGEEEAGRTFAQDSRQRIKNVQGASFDLYIDSQRGPANEDGEAKVAPKFMQSSYFINCDDARVKQLARKAVGAEKDAWKKALRIEKWVHDHMTTRQDEALATADHVARTLSGDCTEYSMLTAAMCRAEGVPARTAIGLIYADTESGPAFAFHMWTEVWILGRWIPIDATLGQGYVGATHLKITDHSWNDTRTLNPLLPLLRVLGRLSIDVVRVE
ncbi:MAG: transglutaminase domain-containing protein [Planctomycetes bacterium]|nr:transglutaminase domain-containing protein [Planctomycetota bacterium]